MIVAMDNKGGIGKNNRLPWHLRTDLIRFKKISMNHHLVMGRKTYETIGKPLPGRTMIIITRNKDYHAKGCVIVNSLEEAIRFAEKNNDSEVFIIGGGEIYQQSISIADKIYLTYVHADVDADVFFPQIDESQWTLIWHEVSIKSENDEYASDFKIFVRNQ